MRKINSLIRSQELHLGGLKMKLNHARNSLIVVLVLLALPIVISAQNRKPRLRRPAPRVVAPVLVPVRFNEATVHGHIRSILKSGKVTGRTTMNLAFDSIDLTDNRHGVVHGYVTKVYGSNGTTDQEGGVQSSGRGNQTLKRSGIGAAAGAIIGGIAGGGKGAAIGLILGGAGGAGSLAIKGSKELKLESGTEMLVHVTR